ncbi:MAG: hypothetical protein IJ113_09550 [Eggerthellaceae bacterium]|nr:hypothetical protein [Eggerthellaceae bacterium]
MKPQTRKIVDSYSKAMSQLTDTSKQILQWKLDNIDWSDITAGANEAVRIMEKHCGLSARQSASLAAKFYDGLRQQEIGERLGAEPFDGREPAATENVVRGFVNRIVDKDDVDGFNRLCGDRLDYEMHNAARNTIGHNTYRDPHKPKYAVVPSGDCCTFCAMLASRGPVYSNPSSCENFHAHCTCSAVPTWERDKATGKYVMNIDGYDQDYYLDRYKHPEEYRGISRDEYYENGYREP